MIKINEKIKSENFTRASGELKWPMNILSKLKQTLIFIPEGYSSQTQPG